MRRSYSPEVKAQAIARVLAGETGPQVARSLRVPEGTIKAWMQRAKPETAVASLKREGLVELIDRFAIEAVKGFIATAELLQDREYLRKSPPDAVAILYGVLTDKWIWFAEQARRDSDAG